MAINLIYSFLLLGKMFFLFDQEAQENTLFMLFRLNENIIHIACVFLENSFCAFFLFFFTVLYQDNLFPWCLVSRHFFITTIVSYVIVAYVSFFIFFF